MTAEHPPIRNLQRLSTRPTTASASRYLRPPGSNACEVGDDALRKPANSFISGVVRFQVQPLTANSTQSEPCRKWWMALSCETGKGQVLCTVSICCACTLLRPGRVQSYVEWSVESSCSWLDFHKQLFSNRTWLESIRPRVNTSTMQVTRRLILW